MKKRTWWPMVLLAAMSPLAFLPDSSAQNPAPPTPSDAEEKVESRPARRDACTVIREFLARDGQPRSTFSCGEGEMDFAIALVPDPLETNLSLFFDRFVESITMGASDAGYLFDRYYYPWDPQLAREEPDLEKRRKMEQERLIRRNQPGVLVFRAVPRPLAIFLVGETPTSGIRTEAFRFAMTRAGKLPVVRILGPSFSGSVDSLIKALKPEGSKLRIVTGSATSTKALGPLKELKGVTFQATLKDSDAATKHALTFLEKRVRKDQIVLLREGETEFAKSGAGDQLRSIAFPRELAHLRDAYAALPRAPKQKGEYPPLGVVPDFTLDLREGIWGRDKAPQLSRQTPASQFALLEQIARQMRESDVRHAGIVATSVVDTIFLIQFLRERLPSVRFFTFDSDQLYVKAAAEMPIGGTLNFATFPSGLKTPGGNRVFSSDTSFGVYAAATYLFDEKGASGRASKEGWNSFSVSVVSRTGLWAVEELTVQNAIPAKIPWSWLLTLSGALAVCCVFAGMLFVANRRPMEPKRSLLYMYWVREDSDRAGGRAAHLFRLVCIVAALLLFISLPLGAAGKWMWPWRIAAAILAAAPAWWLAKHLGGSFASGVKRRWRIYAESGILLLLLLFASFYLASHDAVRSSLHRLRSLSSGVTPLLPVWFLLGGLAYGAYVELRRYFLASERKLTLPGIGDSNLVKTLQESIEQRLQTALAAKAWFVLLPAAALLIYDPASIFLSIEPPLYDWLARVLFCLLLLALFINWVRVIRVWRKVRLLLEHLERHPVGKAISRLPQDKDLSPFAVVRFLSRSLFFEERALEAIARANHVPALRLPLDGAITKCKDLIRKVSAGAWVSARQTEPLYSVFYKIEDHVLDYLESNGWDNGEAAKAAGEYIALFFVQFLRLVMAHLRSLLVFVTVAFVLLQLSLAIYPWQGARNGSLLMACILVIAGAGVMLVFMQTERDAILSHLSGSPAGELGSGFWLKMLSYGAIPLATVLATYFPEVGRWLFLVIGPVLAGLN
jgi:hypothetical protein